MVLNVSISPAAEAKLREKATAAGLDVAVYAGRYLELMVEGRPIMGGGAGGDIEMSEDEIAKLIQDEIHEMRAERRARKTQ